MIRREIERNLRCFVTADLSAVFNLSTVQSKQNEELPIKLIYYAYVYSCINPRKISIFRKISIRLFDI